MAVRQLFSAQVAPEVSGNTLVEKDFLENFALPDSFPDLPKGILPECYPADVIGGGFIPNWPLWLVLELSDYYKRSHDEGMIQPYHKKVYNLLNYFKHFENKEGLLENLNGTVFIKWSKANDFTKGVNFPTNMLCAAALEKAGKFIQ